MFAERLDFIMKVTDTSAAALGRASSLDASHISRLRSGARKLPKTPEFLSSMSDYLESRITSDYQRDAMCKAIGVGEWPLQDEEASSLVEEWLSGKRGERHGIAAVIESIARPQASSIKDVNSLPISSVSDNKYYFGNEGKRTAVDQFFSLLLSEASHGGMKPITLLLVSEEGMEWLYEDPSFAARWTAQFKDVIAAGNRVRIIHTLSRNLTELLEAISKWIPIYMTGAIEPFYCPRIRDGITKRTLFVAPGIAAINSFSIGENTDGMLNEFIRDRDAIAALELEYANYLELCKPLMKINRIDTTDDDALYAGLLVSDKPEASCIVGIAEGLEGDDSAAFAEIESLAAQNARIAVIRSNDIPDNLLIAVREDSESIVVKMDAPAFSFRFNEPHITSAFAEYLSFLA